MIVSAGHSSLNTCSLTWAWARARIVKIRWNQVSKDGYIIAPNLNGGEKSCWDATFANTPCT